MFEPGHFVELIFKLGLGIGQQFFPWHLRRVYWNGFLGHKHLNNMLDNRFSPAYTMSMKTDRPHLAPDRLQTRLPIIC